jgi:hypothetical protein
VLFNCGEIKYEQEDSFCIYFGNVSREKYDSYVKQCKEAGFTVDYSKSNTVYWAYDAEGYYMQTLPQGTYDFIVSKSGYLPYSIKGVVVNPDETTYMETIALGVWATTIVGSYGVIGTVKDALYGNAVSGATVKLRKGWNNQTGNYVKDIFGAVRTATTNSGGAFIINVGVGSYTAEISKDGYDKDMVAAKKAEYQRRCQVQWQLQSVDMWMTSLMVRLQENVLLLHLRCFTQREKTDH